MELITRGFIGRSYITEGDSHKEVRDTLDRLPLTVAVQTHYEPATDFDGSSIVAVLKGEKCTLSAPYYHEHNRDGAHYVAAMALIKQEFPRWGNLVLLGAIENAGGYLFMFGEDGLTC